MSKSNHYVNITTEESREDDSSVSEECKCENLRFSTEISDRGSEFNVVECLDCDWYCVS